MFIIAGIGVGVDVFAIGMLYPWADSLVSAGNIAIKITTYALRN